MLSKKQKHFQTSLKWNKEHPERYAEIKKAYKERNIEKHREWNKIWRERTLGAYFAFNDSGREL